MKVMLNLVYALLTASSISGQPIDNLSQKFYNTHNIGNEQQRFEINNQSYNIRYTKESPLKTVTDLKSVNARKFKLDYIIWDEFNPINNDFSYEVEKWEFTYNEKLLPVIVFRYNLDESFWSNGGPNDKLEMTYYPDDKPKEAVKYKWHIEWYKEYFINYIYDSKGLIIEENICYLSSGVISLKIRYSNTYDSSGNKIMTVQTDLMDSGWNNYHKSEFEYDSLGKVKRHNQYNWSDILNNWEFYENNIYTYDSTGYKIITTGGMQGKREFFYDNQENLTYYTDQVYDWNQRRKVYEYDNRYDYNDLVLPTNQFIITWREFSDFDFGIMKHMLTDLSSDWLNDKNWIPIYKAKFYYSEIIQTDISSNKIVNLVIYPNPANEFITVSCGTNWQNMNLKINDIYGKLVLCENVPGRSRISIKHLSKGIYISQILINDEIVFSTKLIIQ